MTAPPNPPPEAPEQGQPAPFVRTPNAERYLLEADNLRRRQLRSALLHGSSRTWRDRRLWPAVIAGIILVAVISAAIGGYGTFKQQQREREQEEREREEEQRLRGIEEEEGAPAPARGATAGAGTAAGAARTAAGSGAGDRGPAFAAGRTPDRRAGVDGELTERGGELVPEPIGRTRSSA